MFPQQQQQYWSNPVCAQSQPWGSSTMEEAKSWQNIDRRTTQPQPVYAQLQPWSSSTMEEAKSRQSIDRMMGQPQPVYAQSQPWTSSNIGEPKPRQSIDNATAEPPKACSSTAMFTNNQHSWTSPLGQKHQPVYAQLQPWSSFTMAEQKPRQSFDHTTAEPPKEWSNTVMFTNKQPSWTNSMPPQPQPCSVPPLANKVVVIDPSFCAPYTVHLTVTRKKWQIKNGNFTIEDLNQSSIFTVNDPLQLLHVHRRRVLLDATGSPFVILKEKMRTAHNRWLAFRGASENENDLLFSGKRPSLIQRSSDLDVYLATNTNKRVCEYKVRGCWKERSCVIYDGVSNVMVAQVHKKLDDDSKFFDGEAISLIVQPNVDYAFIVALITMVDAIDYLAGVLRTTTKVATFGGHWF